MRISYFPNVTAQSGILFKSQLKCKVNVMTTQCILPK